MIDPRIERELGKLRRYSLSDYIEAARKNEKRKIYKVIRLPCKHTSIEITKPQDQWVVCPKCMQRSYLTWQHTPKLTWNG